MEKTAFTLFETPIGRPAIAWTAAGVVALHLPEASGAATEERLRRRYPEAVRAEPPDEIREAIMAIVALTSGEARDLGFIRLDLGAVGDFERRVYDAARAIPPGETTTYGEIAQRIGEPGAAQAVGRALGRNPVAIVVPCHRVLAADGKTGGFSAHGGVETKLKLLSIERARTGSAPSLFDDLPFAARQGRRTG
jgi:methylated-DNA-[protein]-cysteine S-methyltransferase